MLTAEDVLAKTLAKSQKVTFWSQKNGFTCFFFFPNCWRCSKDDIVAVEVNDVNNSHIANEDTSWHHRSWRERRETEKATCNNCESKGMKGIVRRNEVDFIPR